MRIGDSAPSALLRAPASPAAGTDFLRTFGSVQRAYRNRRPPDLYEVPDRQERQRQFEARARRLEDAAQKLEEAAPSADYEISRKKLQDVEKVATTREVTTETEVRSEATPARQASVAFSDPDEKIAAFRSKLHLRVDPSDPVVGVRVGPLGASLNELAELINEDDSNGGRVEASVIEDAEGFRLLVETTATGSDASLTVTRDTFRTPKGQAFSLIDSALAERGQDESTEIISKTEEVEGTRRKATTREIETRQQVSDAEFAARVSEYAAAYNELRSFADEEQLDVGDDFGAVGNDVRIQQVISALNEVASSLASRSSESGSSLADLGITLEESGTLRIDDAALQAAVASNTSSVVQLLNSADGGLASDTARALAPPEAAAPDTDLDLRGFLNSLSNQQGQLEARAGLLEDVVSALSRSAPSDA